MRTVLGSMSRCSRKLQNGDRCKSKLLEYSDEWITCLQCGARFHIALSILDDDGRITHISYIGAHCSVSRKENP